jgi:hypothetical protein
MDFIKLEKSLVELSEKIKTIQSKREERLSVTKGRFNLFTILRRIGEETQLHSNFICYLLNPKADHDCDRTFLDLFIETLADEKHTEIWSNSDEETDDGVKLYIDQMNAVIKQECKEVRTEKVIDNKRRIDIYLEFEGSRIAIENKISAGEQPDQVFDYAKYLDKNHNTKNFLFYLTLWGSKSVTARNQKYFIISYEKHILNWIERCLKATYKYVNINQALQQYENVIRRLTNQTLEKDEMKEIKDMLKNNPKVIESFPYLTIAYNELVNESVAKFWEELLKELSDQNTNLEVSGRRKTGKRSSGFSTSIKLKDIKYRGIYFRLDDGGDMVYMGINMGSSPKDLQLIFKERKADLENLYNEVIKDCEYKGASFLPEWPLGSYWIYEHTYLKREHLLNIMDDSNRKNEVEKVASNMNNYIKLVSENLVERLDRIKNDDQN